MSVSDKNFSENENPWIRLVRQACQGHGLVYLGAVPLSGPEEEAYERFERWLREGRHAGMQYLAAHKHIRRDPREALAGARSAIVVGLPYSLGDKTPRHRDPPRVAQYARWRDYHKVLWRKGESILTELHDAYLAAHPEARGQLAGRVLVDSAPILERALAARTNRGFIGKNTCFISVKAGSLLLLTELITTVPLDDAEPDMINPAARSTRGGCGSCRRCQVHCPTGALDDDYRLDANRCLAYWTIEHRGTIPERFWPWLATYWFGCDICQLVCPYNRGVPPANNAEGRLKLQELPPLYEVATMSADRYIQLFAGTPLTRARREGLVRNALIAMHVTHDPRLIDAIACIRNNDLATEPTVAATLAQIASPEVDPAKALARRATNPD